MTLWNIIRDFFVQYVFGGIDSNFIYYPQFLVGNISTGEYGFDTYYSTSVYINAGNNFYDDLNGVIGPLFITMGDWLSTTATIITLVGLFIAITLLIISLFKWIVRLVSLRG